jgi:hypothetical protein
LTSNLKQNAAFVVAAFPCGAYARAPTHSSMTTTPRLHLLLLRIVMIAVLVVGFATNAGAEHSAVQAAGGEPHFEKASMIGVTAARAKTKVSPAPLLKQLRAILPGRAGGACAGPLRRLPDQPLARSLRGSIVAAVAIRRRIPRLGDEPPWRALAS